MTADETKTKDINYDDIRIFLVIHPKHHCTTEPHHVHLEDDTVLDPSLFAHALHIHVHISSDRQSLYALLQVWQILLKHAPCLEVLGILTPAEGATTTAEHVVVMLMREPHPTMHTLNIQSSPLGVFASIRNSRVHPVPDSWKPHVLGQPSLFAQRSTVWHSCMLNLSTLSHYALYHILEYVTCYGLEPFVHLIVPQPRDDMDTIAKQTSSMLLEGRWSRYLVLLDVRNIYKNIFQPISCTTKDFHSRLRGLAISDIATCVLTQPQQVHIYEILLNERLFPRLHTLRVVPSSYFTTVFTANGRPMVDQSTGTAAILYAVEGRVSDAVRDLETQWLDCAETRLLDERSRLAKERERDGVVIVLSFLRANRHHPLQDSIFSLVPTIRDMIGSQPHAAAIGHASALSMDETDLLDMRRVSAVNAALYAPFSRFLSCIWIPALDMTSVLPLCVSRQADIVRVLHRFVSTRYANSVLDHTLRK